MALNNLKGLSDLAMAAKGKKGKEVLTVPVDDVVSKSQVRKRFRNIEELAATLLTEGQQSPIIVYPKNEEGKFVIQKGERRWRACKHASIKKIDLIINNKIQNTLDETAGELIENIQRDDLTPVEIAEALNKFIEDGWKQKDLAARLGKNITYISTHLSLLKLSDFVRELYDNNVCSDTETLNNLRLLFELNEERCRAVCAVAMANGISRKQSRELLNDAKRIQEEKAKAPKSRPEQRKSVETGNTVGQPQTSDGESAPIEDQNKSGDKLPPLPKGEEWKKVPADNLIFAVNVKQDGETKRGVIMMDRVALVPSWVWVKTLDSEGQDLHVPVSDIELLSVEG